MKPRNSPEITIANRQKSLPPHRVLLRRTLTQVLRDHDCPGQLSLALVEDREIQRIHRDFLGKDSPTDVISFHYDDEHDGTDENVESPRASGPFGEVVVSAETALREARKRRIPPRHELLRYAVHGVLHLLGYDDHTREGKRKMRRKEDHYLASAGQKRGS